MKNLIREIDWVAAKEQFTTATPFNHVVIDNFFLPDVAEKISNEFPDYNDLELGQYNSPLEHKKVCNHWDRFPKTTYQAFTFLGRTEFVSRIRYLVGDETLNLDFGLNGGGWHMHTKDGVVNIHLDYNVHPKLREQRKVNIIIYLTPNWDQSWGGGLELWTHDPETRRPKEKVKTVDVIYNRAVIFDTTQNSWHGLPTRLTCAEGVYRNSLAAYYVRPAPEGTDPRGKVLYAPNEDQKGNAQIEELIRKRANVDTASQSYRPEEKK